VLRNATMSPEGAGYGNPKIVYNPTTQSSVVAIMPWTAQTAVVELDSSGGMVGGTFQFIPGVSAGNFNAGTKQVAAAADPANSRFLVGDVQAFLTMRSSVFSASAQTAPPPQSPPPAIPQPPPPPPAAPAPVNATLSRELARSDFNGDGSYDLLWQHPNGSVVAWFLGGNKLKSMQMVDATVAAGSPWSIRGTGDFNGDGKPDILWQHMTQGFLAVWLMNGTHLVSVVAPSLSQLSDTAWKVIGVGDFNGDGKPDLVWRHDDGSMATWLMDGTTVTTIAMMSPSKIADLTWTVSGVGDFNGDGKSDLLWRRDDGSLAVWFMNGVNLATVAVFDPGAIDPAWQIASIADANGDGKPDIIWRRNDGWLALWYLNGTTLSQTILMDPSAVGDLNWKIVGPK